MNNNSLSISVRIDQQAALLAGRVLGPTAEITISPDTIPADLWPVIVGALDMLATPPAVSRPIADGCGLPPLADATPEALCAAVRAVLDAAAVRAAERAARLEAEVTAYESDGIDRQRPIEAGGYTWEKWVPRYISEYDRTPEQLARIAARREIVAAECERHNAAEMPAVEAARAAEAARRAEQEAADKAAKAAAEAAKAARHLESGFWEMETPAYNERRHGSYWCASVSFPSGPKPVYAWGESTGKWGRAGLLRVSCKPGDVIAWGQKDLRRPDRSEHELLLMLPDGHMKAVTALDAFRLQEGTAK